MHTESRRRWRRHHSISVLACDVVVWAIWFGLTAAVLLAMCALVWVVS